MLNAIRNPDCGSEIVEYSLEIKNKFIQGNSYLLGLREGTSIPCMRLFLKRNIQFLRNISNRFKSFISNICKHIHLRSPKFESPQEKKYVKIEIDK